MMIYKLLLKLFGLAIKIIITFYDIWCFNGKIHTTKLFVVVKKISWALQQLIDFYKIKNINK